MPETPTQAPHSPVRDDASLAANEDLDRQPDGVPHSVVGMTFGFSVILALLVAFMFAFGNTVSRVMAVAIVIVAIPVLVKALNRRSESSRDHLHPSR
jgi:Kef-type K+ transport system membrane component KefB|nr:hypothetical protein [Kofleriaceae bacterium]